VCERVLINRCLSRSKGVCLHVWLYCSSNHTFELCNFAGEKETAEQRAVRLEQEAEARRAAAAQREQEAERKRREVRCVTDREAVPHLNIVCGAALGFRR
jgi:hypothetical protein